MEGTGRMEDGVQGAAAGSAAEEDRIGLGIAAALMAIFFFTIMDTIGKWLTDGYAPAQIAFLRYAFGLIPVAAYVAHAGGLAGLRTRRPLAHAVRALLVFGALYFFISGLEVLSLAEAIAVAFTAPLFVTALSVPLLGEAVGPRRWAAVIVGFGGALIMIRPGSAAFQPEALYVLAAALCYALAMLWTRRIARGESNTALLAYTTLGAALAAAPFVPTVWQTPQDIDLWLFLLMGLVGSGAGYLLILAYRHAPAAVVAPFDYSALIWGSLFGWILWREEPDPLVWLGAAIIAAAGLYITRREAASRRQAKNNAPARGVR